MTSLTVLTSPPASTQNATFLLTTTNTSAVTKIAPKRDGNVSATSRSRRNGGGSRPAATSQRGPSVARRNERERNRVRQVNLGFATLRQHVPNRSKKMSKVETLRSAVQYIRQLQQLLGEEETEGGMLDENCGSPRGGVPAFAEAFARTHHQPSHHHHLEPLTSHHSTGASASSPAPSLGSDASSPYDSLSPEDEELIDFTTWLS